MNIGDISNLNVASGNSLVLSLTSENKDFRYGSQRFFKSSFKIFSAILSSDSVLRESIQVS